MTTPVSQSTGTTGNTGLKRNNGFNAMQNPLYSGSLMNFGADGMMPSMQGNGSLFGGMPPLPVNAEGLSQIGSGALASIHALDATGSNNPFARMNVVNNATAQLFSFLDSNQPTMAELEKLAAMDSFSPFGDFMGFMDEMDYMDDTSTTKKGRMKRQKLSPECEQEIEKMAKRLKMPAEAIKAVIYAESGGDPAALNPKSGTVGLIQFTKGRARQFNRTSDEIRQMSALEQMPLIEKYLASTKKAAGFSKNDEIDSNTVYSLVFLPAFAKKEVLCTEDTRYYKANRGLDFDKDGQITKTDLGNILIKRGGLKGEYS